jgi:ABC-type sugar transport system substrate-binding protein
VNKLMTLVLVIVVIMGIALAGCTQPETPSAETPSAETPSAETPSAETPSTGIPAEPEGFPQPNPLWGLGFKPDGTPYNFVFASADVTNPYWKICNVTFLKICDMAGAETESYNANWDLDTQISTIEDMIERNVDAIGLYPVDSAGCSPAVSMAERAGIPVFCVDVPVESEELTFVCTYDQYSKGKIAGEIMTDVADELGKELNVLELWCPMSLSVCADRSNGFNDVVGPHPLVTVVQSVPTKAQDELAMNTITEVLPANPEINAIYLNGGMYDGTISALKELDRYYPIGNPEHVVWVAQDTHPSAAEALRDSYLDGVGINDPWALADASGKACLTYVCLQESIPNEIILPMERVTPENLDISPYGGEMRWGPMLVANPDVETWPLLDMAQYGMPTPSFE